MSMKLKGLFKASLKDKITRVFGGGKDKDEIIEELEELLILSDISTGTVEKLLKAVDVRMKIRFDKDDFLNILKDEIEKLVTPEESRMGVKLKNDKSIILMVGINGSGKTTTSAKLANYYRKKGRKVMMAAADTFRAAGSSQLSLWGERLDIPVVGGDKGADPGSVVFNSLSSFQSRDADLLIVDTAGRVQTRDNLMRELEKMVKIIKKFYPEEPTEVLLVVDGTQGRNTLEQARIFNEFSGLSGLVLSKVDGTAKGGTVLDIVGELEVPVKFVGVGETADDILEFSPSEFTDSLFE